MAAHDLALQSRLIEDSPRGRRRISFVSVVLPCLNEEEAVGATVAEAFRGLAQAGYAGEVLVVDNGSTDRSVERAEAAGARVVHEARKGYGAAHITGVKAAHGDVIVMADADLTYDLEGMADLLQPLTCGVDMVVTSRLRGKIDKGAMPVLHRYVGTPILTGIMQTLTGTRVSDCQSGYRAFWRQAILDINLGAPGMEYVSEMLLKAARNRLEIEEVPSNYRRRVGESKLRTLHDGWRNIRMLLLLNPHFTLVTPGLIAMLFGILLCCISLIAPSGISVRSRHWLPFFLGPIFLILGAHAITLGGLAAYQSTLTPARVRKQLAFLGRAATFDRLVLLFLVMALIGVAVDVALFTLWLLNVSSIALVGPAGIAQSLIIIGFDGLATVFAADYAHESLGFSTGRAGLSRESLE